MKKITVSAIIGALALELCILVYISANVRSIRMDTQRSTPEFVTACIARGLTRLGYSFDTKVLKIMVNTVEQSFPLFNLHTLDTTWIYAIFIVENPRLNPNLIGKYGEIGIGQLMPESIIYARKRLGDESLNPFFVEDNILMSLAVLELKGKYYNSVEHIITAYNGVNIRNKVMCTKYYTKVLNVRNALVKEKNLHILTLKKKI